MRHPVASRAALATVVSVAAVGAAAVGAASAEAAATEDIEFIAEHLPETAMDNRYATLPVWSSLATDRERLEPALTLGYSRTGAGGLRLSGPTLGAALRRRFGERWSAAAFGFYDRLSFSGSGDPRPLRTLAIESVPLPLPAPASFDSRGGHMEHTGLGFALTRTADGARLGRRGWIMGVLIEQVRLRGYVFDYRILGGAAAGTTGRIGFDGDYAHVTPFAGVEFPRTRGRWTFAPHALFALPLPRRGVFAQISGPGFTLRGDTATSGRGRHFGDPSLALGFDATYEPWGLSVDLGSTLTQATLERLVHVGIDSNASVAVVWRF